MTLASQAWWDEAVDGGPGPDCAWERAFEQAWPLVERRLRVVLRARRVPPSDWDDYLQEVAARVVVARLRFERPEDIVPWATTVLRRLHLDNLRRAERLQKVERRMSATPRRTPDVASTVMAKLDLDRVAEVMGSWSSFDRDALLVGDGESAGCARGTNASYVRRYRLRASLLRVIDGMAGVFVGVRRFHLTRSQEANDVAALAVPSMAMACAAFVLPLMSGSDAAERPRPAPVIELASATTPADTPAPSPAALTTAARERIPTAAGTGQSGTAPPRVTVPGDPMRLPVEYRTNINMGGHMGYVVMENNEGPEPLYCSNGVPGLPDRCVESPVNGVDYPVDDPW